MVVVASNCDGVDVMQVLYHISRHCKCWVCMYIRQAFWWEKPYRGGCP